MSRRDSFESHCAPVYCRMTVTAVWEGLRDVAKAAVGLEKNYQDSNKTLTISLEGASQMMRALYLLFALWMIVFMNIGCA